MRKFLRKSILGIALLSCGPSLASCLKTSDLENYLVEEYDEKDEKTTTSNVNQEEVVVSLGGKSTEETEGETGEEPGLGNDGENEQDEYTLTFVFGHGIANQTFQLNEGDSIEHPIVPEVIGYTFRGWDNNISIMPAENVTITALWNENTKYTLTFVLNNDQNNIVQMLYENQEITYPEEPIKNGYSFAGWDKPNYERMPASNLTITATWTQDVTYNVTFKYGYGKTSEQVIKESIVSVNKDIPYPAASEMTRTNYVFDGWDYNETKMPEQDLIITAKWRYNVTPGVYLFSELKKANPEPVFAYESACSSAFNIDENGLLTRIGELPSAVASSSIPLNNRYTIVFPSTVKALAPNVFEKLDFVGGVDLRATQITALSQDALANNYSRGLEFQTDYWIGRNLDGCHSFYFPSTLAPENINCNIYRGYNIELSIVFDTTYERGKAIKENIILNSEVTANNMKDMFYFFTSVRGNVFDYDTRIN